VREIELLSDAQVTLLGERRKLGPYGLQGGQAGKPAKNSLLSAGSEQPLPGKISIELKAGDVISIKTPGGGGWGKPTG
jgi:N-methylhydantoinase B